VNLAVAQVSTMPRNLTRMHSFLFFFLFPFLLFHALCASPEQEFPVLYKGRYRPAEAYARLFLYDFYHRATLEGKESALPATHSASSLDVLWSLELSSAAPHPFESLHAPLSSTEMIFQRRFIELQAAKIAPKEIQRILEQESPLIERLRNSGSLFKCLPGRYKEGEWFPLKALKTAIYQPSFQTLKKVSNFTSFSNTQFEIIQEAYFSLERAYLQSDQEGIKAAKEHLGKVLQEAYQPLAGKVFQEAHRKQLTYPSLLQLKIETLYVIYPWISLLIFFYALAGCLLFIPIRLQELKWNGNISSRRSWPFLPLLGKGMMILAFLCHTALLGIRSYLLERAPVSNMFETVLFVSWMAVCAAFLFLLFQRPLLKTDSQNDSKNRALILMGACATSIVLLFILERGDLHPNLERLQAVLDSQFWLIIHVLLVVGSYGFFILSAVMAHVYLVLFMTRQKETTAMKMLSQAILQTMYGGTILLIAGTILGGIWAAQSWGRFWDWDPKESWAFISSSLYLIWIHAYRFHYIASFGLAIGAISGFLAISFTWYAVNYLLGSGLHSYGFGSGGEGYYYGFLGGEGLLLALALWFRYPMLERG